MVINLQAENIFRSHFIGWRLLGLSPTEKYRRLYFVYSVVVNIVVTIGYPLHLMIGLFQSTNMHDAIQNLAINLTCVLCSIKTVVIWLKLRDIREMFNIINRQDKRIDSTSNEAHFYKYKVFKNIRNILKMFAMSYGMSLVSIELAVLVNGLMGSWKLMYPAYFPFEPFANTKLYMAAHTYQFCGIGFQVFQCALNDSFVAMHLALLSSQIRSLSRRVAKLGRDPNKSMALNNQELLECIRDHKDVLLYRSKLEEVIAAFMFFQFFITSINLCVTTVFIIFFVSDAFTLIYYFSYLLSLTAEIFPICYYGTVMENEFGNLTYAIFSSNWTDQDEKFKRDCRIFAETTMRPMYITAWLVRINLNSFITACKNSYSLFAVIMNIK